MFRPFDTTSGTCIWPISATPLASDRYDDACPISRSSNIVTLYGNQFLDIKLTAPKPCTCNLLQKCEAKFHKCVCYFNELSTCKAIHHDCICRRTVQQRCLADEHKCNCRSFNSKRCLVDESKVHACNCDLGGA